MENIYEMYHKNNCKFGFYVARDNWQATVAKIIKIVGVTEGQKIPGKNPYYNNPEVIAEYFRVDPDENNVEKKCNSETFLNNGKLLCPGNYSYYKL